MISRNYKLLSIGIISLAAIISVSNLTNDNEAVELKTQFPDRSPFVSVDNTQSHTNSRLRSNSSKQVYDESTKQKMLVKRFKYINSDMSGKFITYPEIPKLSYDMVMCNEFIKLGKTLENKVSRNEKLSHMELSKLEELNKYFMKFKTSFRPTYFYTNLQEFNEEFGLSFQFVFGNQTI